MGPLSSPTLEVVHTNARYLLGEALASIRQQDSYERSGRPYFEAAWFYRRMALCELLADAHVDAFAANLCRSAQARIHFLRRVSTDIEADKTFTCASKNFPFIDALVSGQLQSALVIARLTTTVHEPSYEPEEAFLLHHFLHALTLHLVDGSACDFETMLARWQRVLRGDSSPHFELCQALWKSDPSHFNQALLDAVEHRKRIFAERRNDVSFKDTLLTEGPIYMTGLAFLRLAELRGMNLDEEYPTMPSLARLPVGTPLQIEDFWSSPR